MDYLQLLDAFLRSPYLEGISVFMLSHAAFRYLWFSYAESKSYYWKVANVLCLLNAFAVVFFDLLFFVQYPKWVAILLFALLIIIESLFLAKDTLFVHFYMLIAFVFVLCISHASIYVIIGLTVSSSYQVGQRSLGSVLAINSFSTLLACLYLYMLTHQKSINMDNWKDMVHSAIYGRVLFFYFLVFDVATLVSVTMLDPIVFYSDHTDGMFRAYMTTMLVVMLTLLLSSLIVVIFASRTAAARKQSEQLGELAKKERDSALHDLLTGLLNRRGFEDEMEKALNQGVPGVLFVMDLDDFKKVNDIFGHPRGDKVLMDEADDLGEIFRNNDILARLNGDEFAVFAYHLSEDQSIFNRARIMNRQMHKLILDDGDNKVASVSASIGIARFPEDGADFETLYANADRALYRAKAMGKDTYALFEKNH